MGSILNWVGPFFIHSNNIDTLLACAMWVSAWEVTEDSLWFMPEFLWLPPLAIPAMLTVITWPVNEETMANRSYNQFQYSLEKMVVDLYMKVTIGATGAPTMNYGKGVASISRTSAGLYRITLMDAYQKTLMLKHMFVATLASTVPAANGLVIKADTVATTKILDIQFFKGDAFTDANTATDPSNGEILLLQITLSNSSV